MSGTSPTPPTVSGGGSGTGATPAVALVVIQPFGGYSPNQTITDAATVTALRGTPGTVAIAWPMPGNTPTAS